MPTHKIYQTEYIDFKKTASILNKITKVVSIVVTCKSALNGTI